MPACSSRAQVNLEARVCRLLADELTRSPAAIRDLVDRALAHFRGASEVSLQAHPDDLSLLDAPDALAAQHALVGPLRFAPDRALMRGGCLVRGSTGELDARIETRVARGLDAGGGM